MEGLTIKQQKFADKYIECGNATESAIYAGYSKNTARQTAAENLSKPYIKSYIDARMAELQKPTIATAEEVLEFLTETMRDMEAEKRDRIKCAELMGKRYALYSEKVQVDGAVPVVFSGEDELRD